MDEYIGLDKDAPQGFGNFLQEYEDDDGFMAVPLPKARDYYINFSLKPREAKAFIAALPSRAPCRTPAHVEGGRPRQYHWRAQDWKRRFSTANGAARKKGRGICPALEREMREIRPSQAQLL